MGTVLASTIISRARGILQDTDSTGYTWSDADLLIYLNDGQRNIVTLKPDAYIVNASVQLVAGTKQSVTNGIALVKLTRNRGLAGTSAGKPITLVLMESFNYVVPDWHNGTACASVDVYMYDEQDPANFYVYPPQPATPGYVEEIYVGLPADISDTTSAITLNDLYEGALLNYVLYRAYSRETDPMSDNLATKYHGLYFQELGLRDQAEDSIKPSRKG